MKTTLEDINPVKKKLLVEIDSKEVDKRLNQAYGEIRKKAKIPGFRPGKVPRKILETYFGNQVIDDVTRELISESFPKAVDEVKTFPLGQPILEKEALKQGQDFNYSAIIEVRPEFEVKDYLGLGVEKEICSISEEDVQKRLEEIREANGKMASIEEERLIRDGDFVIVDYEGFEDGQSLEDVKSSNLLVKVGKNDFHPKFDEALIGLKKEDETEVGIDFEEDFYHTKLAGKSVNFKIKIVDIKELVLPELNDEFASNLGADLKDLDSLKNELKNAITSQEEKRIDRELKQRLLEKISEGIDFELPEVLIDAEIDFSTRRLNDNLERSGSSLEKAGISEAGLKKEFRPASEKRVREMLILDRIAKQDQINIDDDDLEEGYGKLAESMGQDVETVKKYYEARGQVDSLKEELLKEKTLNYLVEHANISEMERDALSQGEGLEQEDK
ncbi:MAG: trigger factor [Desulfobacteraceae bacterium]|nr:trigger factor [Desulfobacteraceae bacterium]